MSISSIITPKTLKEAINFIINGGVAINGGQALLPEVRQGKYRGTQINLVNLSNLPELNPSIEIENNTLSIGASATVTEITENKDVQNHVNILVEAGLSLGDLQIRNSATIGGNLCWGEPRANLLIALIALAASVRIIDSSLQIKEVPLDKFYSDKISQNANDYIILSINVPLISTIAQSYSEFSRQKNDIALVNLALIEGENSVNGCIGGLFTQPLSLKKIQKKQFIQDTLHTVKNTQLEKMKNQFADFEHRVCVLEDLLVNPTKKHGGYGK